MKKQSLTPGLISLMIAFLCLLGSCKKTSSISACIGTLPSTASAGFPVTFTSCTSGASTYSWNFGDGTTGTGDSTTHTYSAAGTYNGSLTVTSGSSSNSKSFSMMVVNNGLTFKGSSYTADSVVASASGNDITAYGVSGATKADLVCIFPTLPTTSGMYTIINSNNAPPVGQQLYVILYSYNASNAETIYGSTGSGTATASVNVASGKISVTLQTIELENLSSAADSAAISATIYQTN